jgi:hypothetical protein
MDASLKVAVATQYRRHDEVVLLHGRCDWLGQWAAVADADHPERLVPGAEGDRLRAHSVPGTIKRYPTPGSVSK